MERWGSHLHLDSSVLTSLVIVRSDPPHCEFLGIQCKVGTWAIMFEFFPFYFFLLFIYNGLGFSLFMFVGVVLPSIHVVGFTNLDDLYFIVPFLLYLFWWSSMLVQQWRLESGWKLLFSCYSMILRVENRPWSIQFHWLMILNCRINVAFCLFETVLVAVALLLELLLCNQMVVCEAEC